MVGWHHQLNGHEFEQTPEDGEGQGSLAYCSPWGHKEWDTTEGLNSNNKRLSGLPGGPPGTWGGLASLSFAKVPFALGCLVGLGLLIHPGASGRGPPSSVPALVLGHGLDLVDAVLASLC